MNKYIYMTMAAAALAFTACEDAIESETKSSMDAANIFSIPQLADAAVMGIHVSFAETNSYRGRFTPYYGLNTDAEWLNSHSTPGDDKSRICNYNPDPAGTNMNTANNAYAKFYEGIERANMCIKGLREYGNSDELKQLLGEALTLRAMIYLDLVKGWRDVPARFEPNTTETIYLAKSSCDVIYKQLLADLKEAEDYCAWPNENSYTKSTERVSKAFVKSLRARIALYAGGYCQRADGSVSLSSDPELSRSAMYQIAKQECIDVINQGCNKLGSFEANFKALSQDVVTAGNESIYEIPFADGRGRVLYTFGVKHKDVNRYTGQAQGGTNGPIPTLFYDYDVDDVRRDITCVPYEWTLQDGQVKGADALVWQSLRSVNSWCFGKLRYEWMTRRVVSSNDDGINWQVMRLADVYMMAAEAVNELDGPASAAQYLKPILDRALPAEKVNAILAAASTKEAFFNTIVEQRRFEFAGEMLRKHDLIRWNLLGKNLASVKQDLYDLRNREGKYADLPENLYWTRNGEELVVYGLNHGETDAVGATLSDYTKQSWLGESKIKDEVIETIYVNDPDKYQFWPIWQNFIDGSNGMLVNDPQWN